MKDRSRSRLSFRGYASPNYTPVPDELFDEQLPDLSGAELKVLLYVIRRTFGFKRESDNISLSQMLNGLRTRDGRVLDRGVGLSKKTLLQAIKSLEEQNIIQTERRRSEEKGDEPTSYRLNVRGSTAQEETTLPVGEKLRHGGGGGIPPGPWGKNYATQETVVRKTDGYPSKFERQRQNEETSDDALDGGTADQELPEGRPRYVPLGKLVGLRREATAHIGNRGGDAGREPVPAGGEPAEADERPARSSGRSGRAPGSTEQREQLRAYLVDFARELGDEAPLAASVTRALNTFAAAGVHPARWGDALYQARSITQERTAQITKQATDGSRIRRKNKMPYFFSVLEQLVGLRPEPTDQPHPGDGAG